MKRTVFALGAVVALFVFAFMAWSLFQGIGPEEPGVIVETGTTPVETNEPIESQNTPESEEPGVNVESETPPGETSEPVAVANLPTLPSLSNASGLGGGFGGGGGEVVETEGVSSGPELGMAIFNPLSGTQFVLNTTLPIEPTSAVVYQQPEGSLFSLEDVPSLAAAFGMSGPVYLETYYIEEGSDWTPMPVYQVFDGTRNLGVGANHIYYSNDAGMVFIGSGSDPMPFDQAQPIAEAFLQQIGLVDFEYRMHSSNGYDIEVRRIIDGREVIYPEISMSINNQGEVWSFSYSPLNRLAALGEYPLRSAEAAWQHLLENGVDFQTVFFNSYPTEIPQPEQVPVDEAYRYWQRTYVPGAEVTLYSYPIVFEAVNGDAAPRILLENFLLNGPADQLEAIADLVGKQIKVEGIAGEMFGYRQTLELVSWEPIEKEYTFREGIIAIGDSDAILTTDDGESIIIPDVPEDLFDGERIYVSGWIDENGRGELDTFNWQGMGIVAPPPEGFEGEPEILPAESQMVNPFGIEEVTISEVHLQYAVLTVWNEETQSPTFYLQPVWQFKGLTDSGDIIEIYVQAVDSEYVNPPSQ